MTERRVVLIRHAKAESTAGTDAERGLTHRGRADAAAVGRWLAGQALRPDRVVVSPALRAQQTWALAAGELTPPADRVTDDRIYANVLDELIDIVRDTPAEAAILCLVGHNPSIAALAQALDDGFGDAAARRQIATSYPTGGVAVFSPTVPWPDAAAGTGTLLAFSAPRG